VAQSQQQTLTGAVWADDAGQGTSLEVETDPIEQHLSTNNKSEAPYLKRQYIYAFSGSGWCLFAPVRTHNDCVAACPEYLPGHIIPMLRGEHKSAVKLPGLTARNQCSDRITPGITAYLRHYGLGGNDTTL
jgi:hypothetical protein